MLQAVDPARAAVQQPPTPTTLVPGTPVERQPKTGDTHVFELTVPAGTAVKLDVHQDGADVRTTLAPREGPSIDADETDIGAVGHELLLWSSPSETTVTVTIRTGRVRGADARYVVRADVIEPTEGLDAAVKAFNAAVPMPAPDKKAVSVELGASLPTAVALWKRIGDRKLTSQTLVRLGRLQLNRLNRPADAAATFAEALEIEEALGDPVDTVEAMLHTANALRQLGRMREGIALNEQALARSAALDPQARAIVRSDLSRVLAEVGEFEASVPLAKDAIAAFKEVGALPDVIVTLERLAQSYVGLRRLDEALEALSEALTLAPRYGKANAQLTLMRTIGNVHSAAGDDERAIAAFRRAGELTPPDSIEGLVLVLDIARQYNRRGDYVAARDSLEALLAKIPPQQQNVWAAVASELGSNLTMLGEPERARELQLKALELVQKGGSPRAELIVTRDLAATERALNDLAAARTRTARMIEIATAFPGNPLQALVLREQARDEWLAGDLPRARQFLDRAVEAIETERESQRAQALRAAFAGNTISYYDDAIDLAMAMHAADPAGGHDGRAVAFFERSRARSLSDLLANARVDIRADVAPEIIARQRDLQRQIAIADAGIRAVSTDAAGKARVTALETEIDGLTRELAVLDSQARAASPRYQDATRPALGSLAEIQALLDDDTVLLAYACGTRKGWAFAVTRTAVRAFALPPIAAIDGAARRVVDAMRTPAPSTAAKTAAAATGLDADRSALSDLVLGPIAGPLAGEWRTRRLAIVASGPLEYVPFAALSLPAGPDAAGARWLGEAHEIVLLPSASVLALLREPRPGRAAPTGGLVVVADPVYSATDPRVAAHTAKPATLMARATTRSGDEPAAPAADARQAADLALTRSDATRGDFARLVFSRQEANALAGLAGPKGAVQVLDFDATVPALRSPVVAGAQRLHIATHGILDATRPERSGLVLSLVDRQGQARDGVLRLNDVFGLSLSAELVVLSGCETGLGRQMRGEGLVGLTRAFMYAGAPRVVSSLWKVDDQATAQLMTRFYRHMLQGGDRPAAALRAAQLEMSKDPRWASPYFWAGFVMQGDWQ